MRSVGRYLGWAAALALAFYAGACAHALLEFDPLGWLGARLCEDDQFEALPSPTGQYRAVTYRRNCGATSGWTTHVLVRGPGAGPPQRGVGEGDYFLFSAGARGDGVRRAPGGHPLVELQWVGERRLRIRYDPRIRPARAAYIQGPIEVVYDSLP